ncbi:hypothetical protein [Kiloniella sp. b19]|uniref:hypothetical protein n=1 Tax=Kiloniella sp. GXU_MW_B19 TaxID=3141326 RepID=UPI0031E4831B
MNKHLTPKRQRQAAFLPFMLEHILDLICIDTEFHIDHPVSPEEKVRLQTNLPTIKQAYNLAREERIKNLSDAKILVSMKRDYNEFFAEPLAHKTNGYALLIAFYICRVLQDNDIPVPVPLIQALKLVLPFAEEGENKDRIEGYKKSAWKAAVKLMKRLQRREYLIPQSMEIAA